MVAMTERRGRRALESVKLALSGRREENQMAGGEWSRRLLVSWKLSATRRLGMSESAELWR